MQEAVMLTQHTQHSFSWVFQGLLLSASTTTALHQQIALAWWTTPAHNICKPKKNVLKVFVRNRTSFLAYNRCRSWFMEKDASLPTILLWNFTQEVALRWIYLLILFIQVISVLQDQWMPSLDCRYQKCHQYFLGISQFSVKIQAVCYTIELDSGENTSLHPCSTFTMKVSNMCCSACNRTEKNFSYFTKGEITLLPYLY